MWKITSHSNLFPPGLSPQVGQEDVLTAVLQSFYVDRSLQRFPTEEQARSLLDRSQAVFASLGFEIQQSHPTLIRGPLTHGLANIAPTQGKMHWIW